MAIMLQAPQYLDMHRLALSPTARYDALVMLRCEYRCPDTTWDTWRVRNSELAHRLCVLASFLSCNQ